MGHFLGTLLVTADYAYGSTELTHPTELGTKQRNGRTAMHTFF